MSEFTAPMHMFLTMLVSDGSLSEDLDHSGGPVVKFSWVDMMYMYVSCQLPGNQILIWIGPNSLCLSKD